MAVRTMDSSATRSNTATQFSAPTRRARAQQSHVEMCPRCQHLTRFQQAPSDGKWVCQKCLRFRIDACSR